MSRGQRTLPSPAAAFARAWAWLRANPDTAAAAFFALLLTSPALLEILIVRPSVTRELAVLGGAFVLWAVCAWLVACRTGLTLRHAVTFLRSGGRLWELLLLLGWVLVLAVNLLAGRGVNAHIPLGYFAFFLMVYIMDLLFAMTGRQQQQRLVLYLVFAVFAIACFRGIFVLAVNPDAARLLSTGSFPESERHLYHLLGVGGYEFFTGLAIGFPMLVYYRMEARKQWFFTICIGLILLGMLFASYTMAVLFTGFGLFLLLGYSLVRLRGKELRSLVLLCAFLTIVTVMFAIVGRSLDLPQAHVYLIKISDLVVTGADRLFGIQLPPYDPGPDFSYLDYQGGSSLERMELYARSLKTFLQNPLTGVGSRVNTGDYSQVGLHSSWLDYLAMYGAPAFALFLCFLALMFRRLHRMRASLCEKAYRTVALVIYLLYGLVNTVIATAVFPVILLFFITGRVKGHGEETPWLPD